MPLRPRSIFKRLSASEWTALSAIAAGASAVAALATACVALWQVRISAEAGRDAALQTQRTAACREMIGSYAAFEQEVFNFIHDYPNGARPPGGEFAAENAAIAYKNTVATLDADEVYFNKRDVNTLRRARKDALSVSMVIITQSRNMVATKIPSGQLSDQAYASLNDIKSMCHHVLAGQD